MKGIRVLHPIYMPLEPVRFPGPDPGSEPVPQPRAHFVLFAMHTLHNTACTPCISFLFLSCILMSFCTIMLFSFAFYFFIRLKLSCCIFLFISHFYLFHIYFFVIYFITWTLECIFRINVFYLFFPQTLECINRFFCNSVGYMCA